MQGSVRSELDARFSDQDASATAWTAVERVLDEAELFWIATVRGSGRPHVTPLTAVWDAGALHFCTGASEQKGVNLAANSACTLTTGTNKWKEGLDVVVEGEAVRVTDDDRLRHLADRWASKYQGDWQFNVVDGSFEQEGQPALVFKVVPSKVLAFSKGEFSQTRYQL
jgi:nitroimidazol reductase NimA-like FMN-containing flavoprotein (pyridoxamine 5'-phosphate oxidase superfamily)